jgi:hypothetical protein
LATLDLLFQQHRDLLALGKEFGALLDGSPAIAAELARVRWQISSLVGRHLVAQDELMRTLGRTGLKPNEQAIFDQYFTELLEMRLSFAKHNCEWTLDAVQHDWAAYRSAARCMITGLSDRIAWEERYLFPVLQTLEANAAALPRDRIQSAA